MTFSRIAAAPHTNLCYLRRTLSTTCPFFNSFLVLLPYHRETHTIFLSGQDITFYDYEIRDVDAWEDGGTPLRLSLDVAETFGTGTHSPTVSLPTKAKEPLSFAALGVGDGLEDTSTAFVANLDDANAALAAVTVHTTAADGAVSASGVLSLGACDSGEWTSANVDDASTGERAAWWDWRDGCRQGGLAEQNVTFGYRMGTMPVLESVWPVAAPVTGGLMVEVSVVGVTGGWIDQLNSRKGMWDISFIQLKLVLVWGLERVLRSKIGFVISLRCVRLRQLLMREGPGMSSKKRWKRITR